MIDTLESLRRKIGGASDLASVVRTMKAVAASGIGQYESAVASLADYRRTVELGLSVCARQANTAIDSDTAGAHLPMASKRHTARVTGAVVFGSDQGLVGQFNDVLAGFVTSTLGALPGVKRIWSVGERMHSSLLDGALAPERVFALPNSIAAISPLIGEILIFAQEQLMGDKMDELYIFHNRPKQGAVYEPNSLRLLPIDFKRLSESGGTPWPTNNLPETIGSVEPALIREYLFISLFQACAESLASECASRLAAMQRAEKNINDLLDTLNRSFHTLRQSSIDEELFDVISGFEALSKT